MEKQHDYSESYARLSPRRPAPRTEKAQESYWAGNSSREELLAVGRELRARHWQQQKDAGVDIVPVGDFAGMIMY